MKVVCSGRSPLRSCGRAGWLGPGPADLQSVPWRPVQVDVSVLSVETPTISRKGRPGRGKSEGRPPSCSNLLCPLPWCSGRAFLSIRPPPSSPWPGEGTEGTDNSPSFSVYLAVPLQSPQPCCSGPQPHVTDALEAQRGGRPPGGHVASSWQHQCGLFSPFCRCCRCCSETLAPSPAKGWP